jgi:hypothetical protein
VAGVTVALEAEARRKLLLVDCDDGGPDELLAAGALELVTSGVVVTLSIGVVVVAAAAAEAGPANLVQKPSAMPLFAVSCA